MAAEELIEWIRREHAVVQDLSNQLRQSIAVIPRSPSPEWLNTIRNGFEKFRAHMIQHIALARSQGYLAAVLEHRPTMSGEVDNLRRGHDQIMRLMDGIHRDLLEVQTEDLMMLREYCGRIERVLAEVDHHEERENNLVTYTFFQDIGGMG